MTDTHIVKVQVSGEFACFTRPDLKVERMSYPCMTPSAARGVLDSILWKPEFAWHIRRVYILNPVKFASIKRNEIGYKQGRDPVNIEDGDTRQQRNSIVLRDVSYVIEASIHQASKDEKNPPEKYLAIFNRRTRKGQCYRRPFLGCREFPAEFEPVEGEIRPIPEDIPIGSMLLDIFFDRDGHAEPRFFHDVAIKRGILDCTRDYEQMLTMSHWRPVRSSEIGALMYDFQRTEDLEDGVA